MTCLAIGYPGYPQTVFGWWNLTGTVEPGVLFGWTLAAWFDWLHLVDTPLGQIGDIIGVFPGLPSVRQMVANGQLVTAKPGDVPWV